jgi:hypothetical protein
VTLARGVGQREAEASGRRRLGSETAPDFVNGALLAGADQGSETGLRLMRRNSISVP